MSRLQAYVSVVLFVFFCFFTSTRVSATELATLTGYITDPAGLRIPQSHVQVTNIETNISYAGETNDAGLYRVSALPSGNYRVIVQKTGFKTIVKQAIELHVQDVVALNFQMEVGSVAESVTVESGTPVINTESAAVSTVVDRAFADNLPMNGRSFQTLIQLTPGVVLTQAQGADSGQFTVNGQRAASNYWMVDGVSANVGTGGGTLGSGEGVGGALPAFGVQGGTNSLVSVDALQEFRIQTSTYAPEFGRTPGGQISIVTRSGTNQFHGTVFDYLRNDALDANDWFADANHLPKPKERQNDFGGTLSGPLIRNRTFFFFSYEGMRLRLPTVGLTKVPTANARQAAIQSMQPILNAFPMPNGPVLGTDVAQFGSSFSNVSTLDATSLRLDQRINDRLILFGRYDYSPSELVSRASDLLSRLKHKATTIQTGTAGLTWNISPLSTNELRFNYSRNTSSSFNTLDSFGGAVPPSASTFNFPSPFTPADAKFNLLISGVGTVASGVDGGFLQQQYNFVDSLSLQRGSHSLKFGADYRWLRPSYSPVQYLPFFAFSNLASAEAGKLLSSNVSAAQPVNFELQNLGVFAQDDWRMSPAVTVSYGVRWDLDLLPSSTPSFPALANFNLANLTQVSLASPGTAPYGMSYGNVAPRVGLAYSMSQNSRWERVLRTGFGVFYDLATQQLGNLLTSSQYPFGAQSATVRGGTYPPNGTQLASPPITQAALSVSGIKAFDPNLKLPYALEWSAALEQALGSSKQSISASYIGSTGRRLLQSGRVFSPNPTFRSVNFVSNQATSDYEALQLQFQRRMSKAIQALTSYTWSHSIDTASAGSLFGSFANSFVPGSTPDSNRGPSDFDVRNAVSAGLTYDIPPVNRNPLLRWAFSGWSVQSVVQSHSGLPVNVYYDHLALSPAQFGANTEIRPDVVPGQSLYLYGSHCASVFQASGQLANGQVCSGGWGFNPNAFALPPTDANGNPTRQGNLGRNALRAFSATQWDFAAHREFPIRESIKLQFRAELFNVLNHPNFAPPSGDLDFNFGHSTQMLGQYLGFGAGSGGFSALNQIGGPRSVQFGLKLQF